MTNGNATTDPRQPRRVKPTPEQIEKILQKQGICLIETDDPAVFTYLFTRLALRGPFHLLTADIRLPMQELIREVRRHTLEVEQVIDHIALSRISRCFQIPDLFGALPDNRPIVVSYLLSVFRQDGTPMHEAKGLLADLLSHLRSFSSPVTIVIRPARQPEDLLLRDQMMTAVNHYYDLSAERPGLTSQQLGLWR